MAPHSGADHARTSGVGSVQIGSRFCNADRGRKPRAEEDQGLERVRPCVVVRTAETGDSGFGPHDAEPSGVLRDVEWVRRARASPAGTPRALPSKGEHEPRGRKEVDGARGSVTSAFIEVRDEGRPRLLSREGVCPSLPQPGRQALESTPVEGVSGDGSSQRVTTWRVEVTSAGQAGVARL